MDKAKNEGISRKKDKISPMKNTFVNIIFLLMNVKDVRGEQLAVFGNC
jgi:hypothetical protein